MTIACIALITLIALLCTVLLARGYVQTSSRMLFWSALCFAGLSVSNGMGVIDLYVVPNVDLYVFRLAITAFSLALLVTGFIWESS